MSERRKLRRGNLRSVGRPDDKDAATPDVDEHGRVLVVLPMPDGLQGACLEVLRVWVQNAGPMSMSVRRTFDDPRVWGQLLCDVAVRIANEYGTANPETNVFEVLRSIREKMNEEWDKIETTSAPKPGTEH